MKSKIIFILTALLLLFLTSCDAVLDAAYPEYAPDYEYESDYNEISTEIYVDYNLGLDLWDIVVMAVPVDEFDLETLDLSKAKTYSYYNYTKIYPTFTDLEDTTYMVFAFQDRDWDLEPDGDEPGIVVPYSSTQEYIDLEFDDSIQTVYGDLSYVSDRIPTTYTDQFLW